MKNLTKGIAAVGALAMLTGVGACGSNTADDKGHVYFLNNKPEVVNQWNELAEMYTKQTGVKVDIQSATSGSYESTLSSELAKNNAPTMFGIGGGTVIVPALVWLGLSQRHAAATSMLAIVPTSISGVISYAHNGNVDWVAAALLFVGMFAGGQFGSWLLSRLPELVLRWVFVVFLIFVTANQVIFTPSWDQRIFMSVVTGIGLVLLGVVIGTLAGLLGIGGGALAVPALSILFGASDLIARGTSLLAMFPNSITTSVANMKRKLVHIKAGLIIGVIAALTTPFGTWVAGAVSPRAGAIMFAAYLCVLLVRSFFVAVKATRAARGSRA